MGLWQEHELAAVECQWHETWYFELTVKHSGYSPSLLGTSSIILGDSVLPLTTVLKDIFSTLGVITVTERH